MALDITTEQEGGKLKAVASGTLPSGQPVVVNADGTVSVVGIIEASDSVGSPTSFGTGAVTYYEGNAAFDPSTGKILFAYGNPSNSQYGTAVIGTITGTAISWGTPIVFASEGVDYVVTTYDPDSEKVIIVWRGEGTPYFGRAVVATISGTSASFGSTANFGTWLIGDTTVTYDTSSDKVVVGYRDQDNSNYGTSVVGTVSGTSISFGTSVVFESGGYTSSIRASYDTAANKTLFVYQSSGNKAVVGTVSGTSISFGSKLTSGLEGAENLIYDESASKHVLVNESSQVLTVSGTSVSAGTAVEIREGGESGNKFGGVYDPTTGKIVFAYVNGSKVGKTVNATVSGTTLTFGSYLQFDTAVGSVNPSLAADTVNDKVLIIYRDENDSDKQAGVVKTVAGTLSPNLTSDNYIGMSGGATEVESSPQQIGSETVFEADSTLGTSCGFDSNSNKVVIAYRDFGNSSYGTAVVGTVSGTSISFGTPVVFNSTGTTDENNVVFDSLNNKIVIVYQDGGNSAYGTAIVGTVSGDTISFGSPTVFFSQSSLSHPSATFDTVNNKVVISYADENDYGAAIVGTVSGTSISFGSSTVFESANTDNTAITFDSSNNKVVVAYQDAGNSNYGTAVVGTVSGTSISFGTPVIFESQDSDKIAITFDSASNKVVVVYQDDGGNNSRYGTAIVGTVSGTSISFGSPSIFESANTDSITASFDSNANKVVIQYRDGGNSDYGTLVFGTVDGSSITFTSPTVFNTANTGANSSVFDSNANKVVIAYQDAGNSQYGTAIVVQAGYTDITRGQVADGGNATVDIVGTVSTNQSGLTAGQQYYVQTDGTVGETPADPSVLAGTAISATKMAVKC